MIRSALSAILASAALVLLLIVFAFVGLAERLCRPPRG